MSADFSNEKFGPRLKKLRSQIAERYDQPSGKNHALIVIIIPGNPNQSGVTSINTGRISCLLVDN